MLHLDEVVAEQHQMCREKVAVIAKAAAIATVAAAAAVAVAGEHTKLLATARHWDPMVWAGVSPSLKPKGQRSYCWLQQIVQ